MVRCGVCFSTNGDAPLSEFSLLAFTKLGLLFPEKLFSIKPTCFW